MKISDIFDVKPVIKQVVDSSKKKLITSAINLGLNFLQKKIEDKAEERRYNSYSKKLRIVYQDGQETEVECNPVPRKIK